MSEVGSKWDLVDSVAGGLGGLLTGFGAAYGVVRAKFNGVHTRIDLVSGRIDELDRKSNDHATAIAVIQSQIEEAKAHRDRVETTQREILYAVQRLGGRSNSH